MYPIEVLCEYILYWCKEHNGGINVYKLNKILYFVQANFLVNTGYPAFKEPIMAWAFGPLVEYAAYKYRVYGGDSIPLLKDKPKFNIIRNKHKKLIDEILLELLFVSYTSLTDLTMNQTPWTSTYSPYRCNEIPNERIEEYFRQ